LCIDVAAPMHEQHEIGTKRAINDQLPAPMPVRLLLAEKIFLRPVDGLRDLDVVGGV